MARVTVEDCIERVPNRFELVLLAGQRARELSAGAMLTIDRDRDKNPVVALREIAGETVDQDMLREGLIRNYQKNLPVEENEDDLESILAEDQKLVEDLSQQSLDVEDLGEGYMLEGEESVEAEVAADPLEEE